MSSEIKKTSRHFDLPEAKTLHPILDGKYFQIKSKTGNDNGDLIKGLPRTPRYHSAMMFEGF